MQEKTKPKFRNKSAIVLTVTLIVFSIISIFVGNEDLTVADLFRPGSERFELLFISRLPRLFSIIITGTSVSIAGMIMQTISRNKFVAPSTSGTTAWCKLGILISTLFFVNAPMIARMSFAFVLSMFGTILFMQILKRVPFKNIILVPLVGMMLGSIVDSFNTFFATRFDLVQNMESWLQGSFSLVVRGRYELLYIGIPVMIVAYLYANKFTIAGMGEEFSTNLGLNHNYVVTAGLVLVSLITSVVTLTVGAIPFIDLIVPNMVSMYRGDNLKGNLLDTALLGANFVLVCDLISRLIMQPYEVPVGVTASIIGSVIFIIMIVRRNKYAKA